MQDLPVRQKTTEIAALDLTDATGHVILRVRIG
jgi:hypothetical protein